MADVALDPWTPSSVRNMDVVGIAERWDKYAYELMESTSASLNTIEAEDMKRILAYNNALRVYVQTIYEAPRMDLPHTSPAMYNIKYLTEGIDFDAVKNKAIRDIVRLYVNGWMQWTRSESADRSNGYYDDDYNRFILIMNRIDVFISAYITEATPIDLPESSTFEDAANKR